MKCPVYYAQLREQRKGSTSDRGDCFKGDCAWWHEGLEDRAVSLVQEYLALITAQLIELNERKSINVQLAK